MPPYKVLAKQGKDRYLLDAGDGDGTGRVYDATTDELLKPFDIGAILARGYWEELDESLTSGGDAAKGEWSEDDHPRNAAKSMTKDWDESKHPRAANGEFGSGGDSDVERTKEVLSKLDGLGLHLGEHENPNTASFIRAMSLDEETAERTGQIIVDAIKDATPVVMVSVPALIAVLEEGRFKTQFETGESRGLLDTNLRGRTEANLFGYPQKGLPTELRPIYGTVAFTNPAGPLRGPNSEASIRNCMDYGEVRVVLKDSVKDRTTFTVGDSLSYEGGTATPALFGEKDPEKCVAAISSHSPDFVRGMAQVATGDWPGTSPAKQAMLLTTQTYFETQIHGGVTVDDIDRIVVPKEKADNEDTQRLIEGAKARDLQVEFAE